MTAQMNHFFLTDWTFQKEISEFYDLLSEIDLNIWEEKKKKLSNTKPWKGRQANLQNHQLRLDKRLHTTTVCYM